MSIERIREPVKGDECYNCVGSQQENRNGGPRRSAKNEVCRSKGANRLDGRCVRR